MSDTEIASATTTAAAAEDTPPPSEMELKSQDLDTHKTSPTQTVPPPATVSFSIWPPSQRTRDAVVARLIETLSSPSVLSKRYGTIPKEEAATDARVIEEEAFTAAGGAAAAEDDGIEILQIYSKEISKRMLDNVKARAAKAPQSAEKDSEVKAEATAGEEKPPSSDTVKSEA